MIDDVQIVDVRHRRDVVVTLGSGVDLAQTRAARGYVDDGLTDGMTPRRHGGLRGRAGSQPFAVDRLDLQTAQQRTVSPRVPGERPGVGRREEARRVAVLRVEGPRVASRDEGHRVRPSVRSGRASGGKRLTVRERGDDRFGEVDPDPPAEGEVRDAFLRCTPRARRACRRAAMRWLHAPASSRSPSLRPARGPPVQADPSAGPLTVSSSPPVITRGPDPSSRPSIVAPVPDARSRSDVSPLATTTWINPGSGNRRGRRPP